MNLIGRYIDNGSNRLIPVSVEKDRYLYNMDFLATFFFKNIID